MSDIRLRSGILLLVVALAGSAAAQSDDLRPLQHEDYDRWNTMNGSAISNDGRWVMYSVRNGKDQVTLHFREAESDREYQIQHASGGQFTFDSQHAVYRITPDPELLKKLRKQKKKPEEMPKNKLEVLHLESGGNTTIPNVTSFRIPREGSGWVAFMLGKDPAESTLKKETSEVSEVYEVTPQGLKRPGPKPKPAEAKKETEPEPAKKESAKPEPSAKSSDKDDKKKKDKRAGATLVLHNLKTGMQRRFPFVTSYEFSKPGNLLVFATSTEDDPEGDGVWVMDLEQGELQQVISGLGNYRNLEINEEGDQVAFVTDRDDYESDPASWTLYHWRSGQQEAKELAKAGSKGIPEGWWVSSTAGPTFSEDGRRLFFNTRPKPEPEDEDEDDEDKVRLDLWHWQDPQLQPQQLLQAERERRRSYRAVYDLKSRKIVQLATEEMPTVAVDPRSTADVAVGTSQEKYLKMMSWDLPGYQDTYLVDLKTGDAELVIERARSGGRMSPEGKYIVWWDTDSQHWHCLPTDADADQRKSVNISEGIEYELYDVLHDTPSEPRPYGIAGWLEDDAGVLVYDQFDIWQLDPTGEQEPVCLTRGAGRENEVRYRYVRLDPELRAIDPEQPLVLSLFDDNTKASGYVRWVPGEESPSMETLIRLDEDVSGLRKARDTDDVMFTRSTFRRSPDIWYSDLDMQQIRRISQINPQQLEYRWGTAELVQWEATDGQQLDGLLYKPDGFDPDQKYPLLVYFYERNSDNLHRYYAPAAGRSIINFSFYVSRGYVLFVPDIPYKTGFPGPSAANSVLSGVKYLIDQGFVDEERIGMQGHSWGGYQTAYLVTQTDMFACAESGAPVSNMTSAYGGIRWGSGMSRMFQYERTQSRIGATLWEDREKYILNSPLFQADKINTPLLILHNDEDGAVPWYQGIELFVALRRLERPAWLLNYNDNPHWVMGKANRRDFARRMQQFFDHYLMDAPMPEWMATGIPAVDKGKEYGFEPAAMPAASGESSEEAGSGEASADDATPTSR